jgi:predicted nucleic acid-binding Zn ribbon protein
MPDQDNDRDDKLRAARDALELARRQARARGGWPRGRAGAQGGRAQDSEAAGPAAAAGPAVPGGGVPGSAGGGAVPWDGAAAVRRESGGDGSSARRGPGYQPERSAGPRRCARPTARRRRDDPQPLGTAIEGLVDEQGWELAVATGSVFGRWAQIVGPELADHTTPESLRDGELTVAADSTAWATQLRLLAAQLVRRLNAELGDGTVLRVKVRGPVTGTRKPGEWRVRGSRGPRDTYG